VPPDKLRDYKAKRDFQETPEPSGKRKRGACREQYASGALQTVAVVTGDRG